VLGDEAAGLVDETFTILPSITAARLGRVLLRPCRSCHGLDSRLFSVAPAEGSLLTRSGRAAGQQGPGVSGSVAPPGRGRRSVLAWTAVSLPFGTGTKEERLSPGPSGQSDDATASSDDFGLPAPPGAVRRLFRQHPWLSDALPASAYLLLATGLALVSAQPPLRTPLWFTALLMLAGLATVLLRRRHPVLMLAAATGLSVLSLAGGTGAETVLPIITLFTVGTQRSALIAWASFVATAAAACGAAWMLILRLGNGLPLWEPTQPPLSTSPVSDWFNAALVMVVPLLITVLFGVNAGQRRRYVAALVDRANRLERERDQQAEIARARERERINREMHDVMAHSVSVMIALSEGARAAARDRPEESIDAIGRVAETGRHTLTELRRLLGAVRADSGAPDAPHSPQPGAPQLADLAAEFRHAGLPVRLLLHGAPPSDPALGLTVYRIVQESLTNALRHARGVTDVAVEVTWAAGLVSILVRNDGPVAADPRPAGRGILGIQERAALYDGTVEAGRDAGGGWRVLVRLHWAKESA
jgi:signal transduction histidine kinase